MPKVNKNIYEEIGQMTRPPPPKKRAGPPKEWSPSLTPTQQRLFDSETRYILAWSEKGSGKTWGVLHKLVRHCYENQDAEAVIIIPVLSMATRGGAWHKLQFQILPAWRDGNRDKEGNLTDDGLGIQFSDVKSDKQHEYIWIENMHGGWSKVVLVSAPHADQLKERIKGFEPSFVFVDELTSCKNSNYFHSVAAQIGRRPGTQTVQQYVGATNPEGPSHWVHKVFFEDPVSDETGEWDMDYEHIYFPSDENVANMKEGYFEGLAKLWKNDPIEAARMVGGQWIDKPSGEGLFAGIYNPQLHIHPLLPGGQPDVRSRIMPVEGNTMIIGLDPGSVYNSFSFLQRLKVDGRIKWVVFDEIVITRKRIPYPVLIPIIMRRIVWWRTVVGPNLPMVWVSDSSAFNQYRAATGSFDVLDLEKAYNAQRERYGLEQIKIKQAPKANGSKPERTRLLQNALAQDEIIISSTCSKHRRMLEMQESEKQKPGEPHDPTRALTPARSDWIHVLDSLTYPMLLESVNSAALIAPRSPQIMSGVPPKAA